MAFHLALSISYILSISQRILYKLIPISSLCVLLCAPHSFGSINTSFLPVLFLSRNQVHSCLRHFKLLVTMAKKNLFPISICLFFRFLPKYPLLEAKSKAFSSSPFKTESLSLFLASLHTFYLPHLL